MMPLLKLAVALNLVASVVTENQPTMTELKKQVLSGYDKFTRPTLAEARKAVKAGVCPSAGPVNVTTQFYVDFIDIDQKLQTYTLAGYLRAWWTDKRLGFKGSTAGGCCDKLIFGKDDADNLWRPDFYFDQAESIKLGGTGFGEQVEVQPSGAVLWSRQSKVKLRCPMHFGNLPYDTQRCSYILGMYSQSATEVILRWKPAAHALAQWDQMGTAVWTTTKLEQKDVLLTYAGLGNYSSARAWLTIKRNHDGYVMSYLVLAVVFVCMSYANFWINPAAVPARTALSVITVLVVSGLSQACKSSLPPFSYETWLTDFMFGSMMFNILGFFEMAAENFAMTQDAYWTAKEKTRDKMLQDLGKTMTDVDHTAGILPPSERKRKCLNISFKPLVRLIKNADYHFRYLFPLFYFIFVIVMAVKVGTYDPPAGTICSDCTGCTAFTPQAHPCAVQPAH